MSDAKVTPGYTRAAIKRYEDKHDFLKVRLSPGSKELITALTGRLPGAWAADVCKKELERLIADQKKEPPKAEAPMLDIAALEASPDFPFKD